jgi:hypothetical protein
MIIMEELLIINWTREAPLPAGENSLPPLSFTYFPQRSKNSARPQDFN